MSIDYSTLPMVYEGASTSILLAKFWPLDDPEKSAPGSPALHDAPHQPEVAVLQLFTHNIFAACNNAPDNRSLFHELPQLLDEPTSLR